MASSERCTGRLCASASLYTSTVWMPSSRQARMIRSAISPRLAIRILSKDSECLLECLHIRHVRGPRLGEDPFRESGEDARWTELDECGRALPVRAPHAGDHCTGDHTCLSSNDAKSAACSCTCA